MLALGVLSIVAHARADESPFDAWARSVAHEGPWKGPIVAAPRTVARPTTSGPILRSVTAPVAVHGSANMTLPALRKALLALENSYAALQALGLPMPVPDGSLGGSGSFDVYFDPTVRDVRAGADGLDFLSPYDGLRVFGLADAALGPDELAPCMTQLLAEAALLALDPAESTTIRSASAWALTLQTTAQLGCRGPVAHMRDSARGLFEADSVEATGLFLATLGARQDGGRGNFLVETWQFARQDSRDRVTLRASPDVHEALMRGLENAGEDPDALAIDFAVGRYFAGTVVAPPGPLRELPAALSPPVLRRLSRKDLPKHVYGTEALRAYGSAYVELDASQFGPADNLRLWLRGDPYLRFALTAIKLNAKGQELGRLTAPPAGAPTAYLPVLRTPDTTKIVIVVTALPKPDYDLDDTRTPQLAGFKLILDRSSNASRVP